MIVSDLSYVETVSENSAVLGGKRKKRKKGKKGKGKGGFTSFFSVFKQKNYNNTHQVAVFGSNYNAAGQYNSVG